MEQKLHHSNTRSGVSKTHSTIVCRNASTTINVFLILGYTPTQNSQGDKIGGMSVVVITLASVLVEVR